MSTAVATRGPAQIGESRQMDALQRIASQATPKQHIRQRKGRGGMVFKYVDGAYVIRTLNEAFGHNWDFEADNEQVIEFNGQPFEIRCRGRLTVRLGGQAVTKVQYGSQAIEFIKDKQGNIVAPVTIGDCFKGAATDALKKCASMLGVALDLYDSDFKASDLSEYEAEPEPVRPVTLEGQQPKAEAKPVIGPGTRDILTWMDSMAWNTADLANYIFLQFKLSVDDTDAVKAIGALSNAQKKTLHQMVKGEFEKGAK